jgi:hypothetical protein
MTQNQIAYWGLRETERSHKENEQIAWGQLNEQIRHNLATEQISTGELNERQRHNVETEKAALLNLDLGWAELGEKERHNKIQELLGFGELDESIRAHKESEAIQWANWGETVRSHQANEAISWFEADTGRFNAETNRLNAETNRINAKTNQYNAQTSRMAYLEDVRHDTRTEDIQMYNANTQRTKVAYDYYIDRYNATEKTLLDTAELMLDTRKQAYSEMLTDTQIRKIWTDMKQGWYQLQINQQIANQGEGKLFLEGWGKLNDSIGTIGGLISDLNKTALDWEKFAAEY